MIENTDNFLIGLLVGGSSVGIYDAAFTVGRLFFIATGAVGVLFTPVFSDLHQQENKSEMRRFYTLTTRWISIVTLLPYLIIVLMSDKIILLLFSPAYLDGELTLMIISTGLFLHAVTGLNGGAITAVGDSRSVLLGTIYAYLSNVGLNVILIPEYGITGAAVASAGSFVMLNIYWSHILYTRFDIIPFRRGFIYVFLFSGIVNSMCIYLLNNIIGWWLVPLVILIHLIIIGAFGLSEEDQELLSRVVRKDLLYT